MTIEEKIKYQYMKIFYERLELNKFEEFFKKCNVKSKEIIDPNNLKISDYFFLQNDVDLSRIEENELKILKDYFSDDIKNTSDINNKMYSIVNDILIKQMPNILFPNTDEKYIWIDDNPFHQIPTNSICFYFHYIKYDSSRNVDFSKVYDKLNYIQSTWSKTKNIKISIIPCEEKLDKRLFVK